MFITTLVSLNRTFSFNYGPCGYLNKTESDFLFEARSRGGAPIGVIAKFQTVAPADKYLTHRSNSVHSHSPISSEASDSSRSLLPNTEILQNLATLLQHDKL